MDIKALPIFSKKLKKYAKKNPKIKDDFAKLLEEITNNPTNAIAIKSNVYKIRMQNSSSNKGKSGGYRVYYFYKKDDVVVLLYIYTKNEFPNLPSELLDYLIKEAKELE